jgi:CRISPR-associated protein Cas2
MLILVTYDVSTETKEGRRRLRNVAKVCQSFGQRVQNSVFECDINQMQYEELEIELLGIINKSEDSLRLYKLRQRSLDVIEYGTNKAIDFNKPLLI